MYQGMSQPHAKIPDEIFFDIFSFLTYKDGNGLITSCHRFHRVIQSPFRFAPPPKLIFQTEGDRPDIVIEISGTEIGFSLVEMHISALPSEIGYLRNLTHLDLKRNQITQLPPEIGNLINLTFLDLRYNQLTQLPPKIENLINLTSLDLAYNQLTHLPPEIGNLTNLVCFHCSYNQLSQLPPEIGNMINLTSLWIGYNRLTSLPSEMRNMYMLSYLSIFSNPELQSRLALNGIEGDQLIKLPSETGRLSYLIHNNQLLLLQPEIENFVLYT